MSGHSINEVTDICNGTGVTICFCTTTQIFAMDESTSTKTSKEKHRVATRSVKTAIAEAALGFSDHTTAHGVIYAACDGQGHTCEKILWALVCLVFSCLAISLTCRAYIDWQQNPVITTILTTGTLRQSIFSCW